MYHTTTSVKSYLMFLARLGDSLSGSRPCISLAVLCTTRCTGKKKGWNEKFPAKVWRENFPGVRTDLRDIFTCCSCWAFISSDRLDFPIPFLPHFSKADSEIQLAVRGCHSSLILWPISQWWWCIINISINQALGISTDWMSLQKEGKKMVENKSKNGLSHLLHFPSPRPRSLSQCLNLNPTWKPERRNRN